jgi:hypothetical protein
MAPAGFYAVGLSFWLRDEVQDRLGRRWIVAGILVGAGLSALLSPQLALASGSAFLFSETLDTLVYTPLRSRNRYLAVAVSNTLGALADTALFLALAGLPMLLLWGNWVGKLEMIVPALLIMALARRGRDLVIRRHPA